MGERNRSLLTRSHSANFLTRLIFESEHSLGGGHADRSLLFRAFQALVIIIRAVTPLSYLYILSLYLFQWQPATFTLGGRIGFRLLMFWTLAEVLFFPYYCYLFYSMNKLNKNLPHFSSNKETRHRLAHNCFQALESSATNSDETPVQYCRRVLEGWFLDLPLTQIHHEDVAAWTAWAFFGMNVSVMTPDERAENDTYVTFLAQKTQYTFQPGFNPSGAPSARLNLDPVFATQRPLVYYVAIAAVNALTHVGLKGIGFKHLPQFDTPSHSQSILFRPKEIPLGEEEKYNNRKVKPLPIVFVHGIGIGYPHYFSLVSSLPTDVDVYLIEWPNVAMQMSSAGPTPSECLTALSMLFKAHNHTQGACFVTHSLGTVMMSWLLKDVEGCKLVASSVIMDPVCFLLCDPTVATNFVYREPKTPIQFMMHFFVSRELFIANALSRHFAWSHNIMFVEDLLNNKTCCGNSIHDVTSCDHHYSESGKLSNSSTNSPLTVKSDSSSWDKLSEADGSLKLHSHSSHTAIIEHTIILSSEDSIVPVKEVNRYLEQKQRDGYRNYEVIMTPCVHGEIMLKSNWVKIIVSKVKDRCGLTDPTGENC